MNRSEDAQRRTSRWIPIGGAVLAAAAVVAVTAFASAGTATGTDDPTPPPTISVDALPAAFDYQAAGEKLAVAKLPTPFSEDTYLSSFVPSTVRLLGSDDVAQYWSGFRDGRLCVLITISKQSASATSCATEDQFKSGGVGIRLLTSDYAREAYLVPDSVSATTGVSLVLTDPFSSRSSAEVEDGTFTLAKLPAVTADEVPTDLPPKLPANAVLPKGIHR